MDIQQTPEEAFQAAIQILGLENTPQEFQEEYVAEFGDMVIQSIIYRVLPDMDEAQQNALESLLEESDNEEGIAKIFAYLEQHVPNFNTVVIEETKRITDAIKEAEQQEGII
ncbi:MAG: hypothetical protein LRY41_01790 [Candidatus Pacebacteria bacterium]|nr:hypothetical protein [Candidatus Paceibacterota bacterium]MCD8507808.1 hypothetical protein [Candidatus Paceibacterota bacterium]MCD8528042.1 hypothetical protein [Candidatus Paceibacterota bacterium]MCD8563876.1 hypothetical protein [Candidatus Paceibacterota bacterium]